MSYCKKSFDQFFETDEEKLKAMDEDKLLKFKHRLLGNIKFVGELNRRNLLQEFIVIQVLNMLLGIEYDGHQTRIDDDTVEGATVLMSKIGSLIDDKITKLVNSKEQKPEKIAKNKETLANYNKIFKKLEEIGESSETDPQFSNISLRVKILVKNMLDDRSKGWEKQRK